MLLRTLCLLASVFDNHEVEEREPPGNKYQKSGPKLWWHLRSMSSMFPFHIFLWIMVMLYVRSKTTDKLMQFKVLIFEFLYSYIHSHRIICCKVVKVLRRSTVQSLDQSRARNKIRPGFSGLYSLWSWNPPQMETDQPLWATCYNALLSSCPESLIKFAQLSGTKIPLPILSFIPRFLAWLFLSYWCEGASSDLEKLWGTSSLKYMELLSCLKLCICFMLCYLRV